MARQASLPATRLRARHVIHTVGPVWRGGGSGEAALLAACKHNSLWLAAARGLHCLAFTAVSAGVYGHSAADYDALLA